MTKMLSIVLALATATTIGCAGTAPVGSDPGDNGGGDDGGSDGGGDGGSDTTPTALDASGTYQMASTFDITTNMPGTVGTIANDFIAATDDPDDPTKWIVDLLIDQLSGTTKSIAQDAESVVVGYANDEVLSLAPTFVTDIKTVGQDFGDMSKHFGLVSTLAVTSAGQAGSYTAVHTVTGVHFKIGTVESDYLFADYGAPNITVPGVGVTLATSGDLTIASHAIPLSYGEILHIGLDAAILPLVDPNATDLQSFFADEIDCGAVGQAVSDAIGFGSAGTYQTACTAGLNYAATFIYGEIDGIDSSPLTFTMAGTAKAFDKNGDGKVDQLATGKWDGTITYVNTPAPMATATFTGARM
jgi:hypothetical protein